MHSKRRAKRVARCHLHSARLRIRVKGLIHVARFSAVAPGAAPGARPQDPSPINARYRPLGAVFRPQRPAPSAPTPSGRLRGAQPASPSSNQVAPAKGSRLSAIANPENEIFSRGFQIPKSKNPLRPPKTKNPNPTPTAGNAGTYMCDSIVPRWGSQPPGIKGDARAGVTELSRYQVFSETELSHVWSRMVT